MQHKGWLQHLCGNVMYFDDDMGRTFELDVRKWKDRTIIYGDGWERYIAKNNFIGGEYIAFSLKGAVSMLRTLYFASQDDEVDEDDEHDQDHDDSQDDQDDGNNQDDDNQDDDDSQNDEDEQDDDAEEDVDDGGDWVADDLWAGVEGTWTRLKTRADEVIA